MRNETNVTHLSKIPAVLREILASLPADDVRRRVNPDAFAYVEHLWHLADLEVEGYGMRLSRLLTNTAGSWPNFDGARTAVERRYIELSPIEAMEKFEDARAANLRIIESASDDVWSRKGFQEGAGEVTFREVVEMMVKHDASHAAEIEGLLRGLSRGVPASLAEIASSSRA